MALPTRTKLTTTNPTAVYTVPAGKRAALTVNIAGLAPCKVMVAITAGAAPVDADWIETQQAFVLGTVLRNEIIPLPADHKIFVQSDTANAAVVQVWGIEENA